MKKTIEIDLADYKLFLEFMIRILKIKTPLSEDESQSLEDLKADLTRCVGAVENALSEA